jgi:hypothetical protein
LVTSLSQQRVNAFVVNWRNIAISLKTVAALRSPQRRAAHPAGAALLATGFRKPVNDSAAAAAKPAAEFLLRRNDKAYGMTMAPVAILPE